MSQTSTSEKKTLSKGTPMGVVAALREPTSRDRKSVAEGIRGQDEGLIVGQLGPSSYRDVNNIWHELKTRSSFAIYGNDRSWHKSRYRLQETRSR